MNESLARKISIIFHPLILVPLSAFIYLYFGGHSILPSVKWIGLWTVISILPTVVYTYFGGERGLNIMDKELRTPVYILAVLSLFASYSTIFLLNGPSIVLEGVIVGILSVLIFGALNHYSKISVHTGTITGTGTAFLIHGTFAGVLLLCTSLLVGKSRIDLNKHTRREAIFGGLTGILCGAMFFAVV